MDLIKLEFCPPVPVNETKDFLRADDEIISLKNSLIRDFAELRHLAGAAILIVLSKKPLTSKGERVSGTASKFRGVDAIAHHWQFLIKLDLNLWKTRPEEREPLLFHQLMHCWIDESGRPQIRSHDLEEFQAVVKHFGAWDNSIKFFRRELINGDRSEDLAI